MTLSSFLLGEKATGKQKAIDGELDALFQSHVRESRDDASTAASNNKKRKSEGEQEEGDEQRHGLKKRKSEPKEPKSQQQDSPPPKHEKRRGSKKKRKSDVQNPTAGSIVQGSSTKGPSDPVGTSDSEEGGPSTIVHESLLRVGVKPDQRISTRREKYAPLDESEEQRNLRTIFVGNIPSEVAQKRPLQKQLHKHILSFVPNAKIECARFRSIAFQNPTTKLPDSDGNEKTTPRQHDRDRASSWRGTNPAADEPKNDEKKFLTPSQKKKVAFIKQELHPSADSVNAYVVFAHTPPSKDRPSNLPPPPPVMDPYEAARLAIEKCNGTVFMNRTIRVDSSGRSGDGNGKQSDLSGAFAGDSKSTVFVGNLDFASREEDVRVFFEGLLVAERGALSHESDTAKRWVSRVRIVRDKDTQLGKGFAYVQFSDRVCVDEVLAMEEEKLKFAKRTLRVQRCKMFPNDPKADKTPAPKNTNASKAAGPLSISAPKGDPSLGEKLATLSKEERKQIKAVDTNRVARRMAKKARMILAKQGVSLGGKEKERERARKTGTAKKDVAAPRKQGRIRSEKSMSKRNMKK